MTVSMKWLTDEERDALIDRALALLERVGMRMKGARALAALADAGARVDAESGVVRFPRSVVRAALASCRRDVFMAGATAEGDVLLDGSGTRFNVSGCAAMTLDASSGVRRPSTLADLRDGTAVLERTPELDVVWTFATANDVPLERRELVEYFTFLTETRKPVVFVDCPGETAAVREVCDILGGGLAGFRARPRVGLLCAAASPLEVNGGLLDVACELASLGAPVWAYSMPIAGATSPVTLAGTVAQMWAEVLGIVSAVQAVAPGAPMVACCGPGVLDMRAATLSLGSLENTLMGAAAVEIGHHLGLPTHNSGLTTDAKHGGVQAGYEKGLKVLAAVGTGADVISGGFGLLDDSSTFCLPMIAVDAEIAAAVRRLVEGFEVSAETLMGDAAERVGIGGNFLKERETRRRVRAGEHFVPAIASRLPFQQWQAEGKTEMDHAADVVNAALAARAAGGPCLDEDTRAALAAVCGISSDELRRWS